METFNQTLRKTMLAFSPSGARITHEYFNIAAWDLLTRLRLKNPATGSKDGSHFLRTALQVDSSGQCLPRSNVNTESLARLFVLDCDSHVDTNGEILTGAPDPFTVSAVLCQRDIGHIIFGSYSHYIGDKGNRYRVLLATERPYNKQELAPTIEVAIDLINTQLEGDKLVNAVENHSWAQPWYVPRRPQSSTIATLYIEHLTGRPIEVIDPPVALPIKKKKVNYNLNSHNKSSLINEFNAQNPIEDLLSQYGYVQRYKNQNESRWLSPVSSSGQCGITVRGEKLFCHHSNALNDGWWHDSFDLFCVHEGLAISDALRLLRKSQQQKQNCRT